MAKWGAKKIVFGAKKCEKKHEKKFQKLFRPKKNSKFFHPKIFILGSWKITDLCNELISITVQGCKCIPFALHFVCILLSIWNAIKGKERKGKERKRNKSFSRKNRAKKKAGKRLSLSLFEQAIFWLKVFDCQRVKRLWTIFRFTFRFQNFSKCLKIKKKKKKVAAKKKKPTNEPKKGHFGGDLMRSARSKTKTSPFCPVFRPLTGFLFTSGTFPCLDIFSWLKTQILKFGFLSLFAYMFFHQIEEKIMRNLVNQKIVSTFAKSKQIFEGFFWPRWGLKSR